MAPRPLAPTAAKEERPRQQQQVQEAFVRDPYEGFTRWLRVRQAEGDTFGFCLSLVFHAVTLSKYSTLPASHIIYYTIYTAATLGLLAWQRSGRPSYAAWRDWVQAAIRLDVFLSPARIAIWEHSVSVPPPSLAGYPTLSALLALPVTVANTLTVHLLMLPFAHTLPLWPHALVQLICAGRVAIGVLRFQMFQRTFFLHRTPQAVLGEAFQWLQLLGQISLSPLSGYGSKPAGELQCQVVVLWLQLFVGFGISVAAQALLDARLCKAFLGEGVEGQQGIWQGSECQGGGLLCRSAGAYNRACDALSRRLLLASAEACMDPYLWLLAAVALFDVLGVSLA